MSCSDMFLNSATYVTAVLPVDSRAERGIGDQQMQRVVPIKRKHITARLAAGTEGTQSVASDISLLLACHVPGMVLENIAWFPPSSYL